MPDVIVIGAGVIGLGIGWRCAQRGLDVTVVDPDPGSGATWTAAGMLAPLTELHYGEAPLLQLGLDSAARYPGFVAELEELTGCPVGYRRTGTVVAAWDGADLAGLHDLAAFARTLGQQPQLLSARELRGLVALLAPGLPGGMFAPDDHQVDPRRLHAALARALQRSGGTLVRRTVAAVGDDVVLDDGHRLNAATVVVAAGAWSGRIAGITPPPVRPVKGQTLRLRLPEPLERTVRGSVKGSAVYLLPRADGQVVVGASSEEAGFDVRPRAGAVYELLRDAQSLLPIVGEATLEEVCTSLRPGSPDNAPLLGRTEREGLLLATGHHRNGILLTPATADGMATLIVEGRTPPEWANFAPSRFSAVVA